MTMHSEEIIDVQADPGNPVYEKKFGMEGDTSANVSPHDRKAAIKVLKRELTAGLESVTIQLRTVPSHPDKPSQQGRYPLKRTQITGGSFGETKKMTVS